MCGVIILSARLDRRLERSFWRILGRGVCGLHGVHGEDWRCLKRGLRERNHDTHRHGVRSTYKAICSGYICFTTLDLETFSSFQFVGNASLIDSGYITLA